ncbi:MAG TPA: primosomal protein N', partial [Xanthobacteraceae bacterium]|nr:primosomal protein N' [Xanthobacteraceae bacterium]
MQIEERGGEEQVMVKRVVDVLVPVALDQAYSYRVPDDLEVAIGDVVRVPLGTREALGAVWSEGNPKPGLHNRLRDIAEKLDVPPLRAELRRFVDWVADYTLSPRGMVLRMALRMGEHLGPERPRVGVRLLGPPPQRMTPARARVLAVLADGLVRGKREVAEEAGVSPGVIDGLVDEGTLDAIALAADPIAARPDPDFQHPELAGPQRDAADALREAVTKGGYSVSLLDGVTGSGKTEVYFEAIAQILRGERQVLILL